MNTHYLNPAGRLFEFLNYVWLASDQLDAKSVWGLYLDVIPEQEPAKFFRAIGGVLALPDEVRTSVAGVQDGPFSRERLLRALPAAEAALSIAPQLPSYSVAQMKLHYDKGTLADLETCSELLSHGRQGGRDIEFAGMENSLAGIRSLADEIKVEATESGLPSDVATLLWRNADAIVRAVDMYRILGTESVIREFDAFVGSLVTKPVAGDAARNTPALWDKVQKLSKEIILMEAAFAVPGQLMITAGNFWTAIQPGVSAVVSALAS
ncbi:hypothetical protein E3O19_08795 [Cryobacterium algoritolerans]|uniref:Uncharacterized protein n=1 Tax=Cryobacterium algoritolerans TaxID=1259184 RepID=A0A4R8WU35_9MICO|nr:hypothetical protein [Cryobacterium algoritolerans]TFC15217.1 hypothetical protein E3O19_08795 [Cryobacterium algoritolerans]